jgi:hypothetical protein
VFLFALGSTDAVASKMKLKLEEAGQEVAVGSAVELFFTTHGCAVNQFAILQSNDMPKDAAEKNSFPSEPFCFGSPAVGISVGEFARISYYGNGQAKIKAKKLTVTEPGNCTYTLGNLNSTVTIPGSDLFEGTATGKLIKHPEGCAKTESFVWVAGARVLDQPLELSF